MKVLFIGSGIPGFALRYVHDIYETLTKDLFYTVKYISPHRITPRIIKSFQPDILFVAHGTYTPLSILKYAKSLGIIRALWIVEDPYEIDHHRGEMAEGYDVVFTNEKQAVKEYSHPRVSYLPWCCNPRVHKRISVSSQYQSDLCFVGMGFPNRIKILNEIASFLSELNVKLIGDWEQWGLLKPELRKFIIPVMDDFREVIKYYNGAKINLNMHRNPIDPPSGNMKGVGATSPNDRVFTLAGCGAFQIVDRTRPDLWDCFIEDREIFAFNDPDDLARKIERGLGNPVLLRIVGSSSQKRAYGEHTFKNRLSNVFRKIQELMPIKKIYPRVSYQFSFYPETLASSHRGERMPMRAPIVKKFSHG